MSDARATPPPPARTPWWQPDRDLVLALAAIVVSTCALGVSLFQAVRMRAQQDAAVWPRLTIRVTYNVEPDTIAFTVRNAGVGPAQVAWAQATYNGVPAESWLALVRAAVPPEARGEHGSATFIYGGLTGAVLVPGEELVQFRLTGPPVRVMYGAAARVGLRACYCSVFDRCWLIEDPNLSTAITQERVTPVAACPRPSTPLV